MYVRKPKQKIYTIILTNQQIDFFVVHEFVRWYLQVQRSRPFADPSRNIVMGPVTGAEPSIVLSCIRHGHATQMRADGQDDDPFVGEDPILVDFRIAQAFHRYRSYLLYFFLISFADEDWFAAPFHG